MARKSASKMLRIEDPVVEDPVVDIPEEVQDEDEEVVVEWTPMNDQPYPKEDLLKVITADGSYVYDTNAKSSARIHLAMKDTFLVFASTVKDRYSLTTFYKIAEGPLMGKYLDKDHISVTMKA